MANQVVFYLNIDPERYLSYYRGEVSKVSVMSVDGRRVEFPASRLRPFVAAGGVSGLFALRFDENNRFLEMVKLDKI
ncbi:MAG: DUF2835 domain-containing protein [Gammaproteobacteria bacterium]|nr:DUF2835 domain-containing protein [Gammaproteobacteria bacterium]